MTRYPHVLLAGCPVDSPLYGGVQRFAKQHAWQLTVEDAADAPPDGWRGDGILFAVSGRRADGEDAARRGKANVPSRKRGASAARRGVPVVAMGRTAGAVTACVAADDRAVGEMAARHYRERSFRHFAWFSRDRSPALALRERGFRETCADAGRGSYRAWTWADAAPAAKRHDAAALSRWLEDAICAAPKPLGVFCGEDRDAMLVINACKIRRLAFPDDVSILGVGNRTAICERECITLSSVRLDEDRIGHEAAALLQRLMAGAAAPREPRLVPPTGVVDRQSTDVLGADDPTLRTALAHIHGHLDTPFGAAQVAAALRIDRNRLDRLFAAELGRSVGQEILRQRIARVKTLLTDPSLRLNEICRRAGFCNASYLIKCFRDAEDCTPLAWRRGAAATKRGPPSAQTVKDAGIML